VNVPENITVIWEKEMAAQTRQLREDAHGHGKQTTRAFPNRNRNQRP
jgi:hypothetical protein